VENTKIIVELPVRPKYSTWLVASRLDTTQ